MKHWKLTLSILALSTPLVFGQMQDGSGGMQDGSGPNGPREDRPRMGEMPEEVNELRTEFNDLREQLRDSRQAVIDELGEDATQEERLQALAQWREDNADLIENVQGVGDELRETIHAYRPDLPEVAVPQDVRDQRQELNNLRRDLNQSRSEAIAALGEDATDEEVQAAIEDWEADNAEQIEDMEALADELKTWFRENRPARGGRDSAMGPQRRQEMQQRRQEFKQNLDTMRQERKALRDEISGSDLTPEERQAKIQEFRDDQRQLMEERKQLKREQRRSGGDTGGDRRPGE